MSRDHWIGWEDLKCRPCADGRHGECTGGVDWCLCGPRKEGDPVPECLPQLPDEED